MGVVLALAAAWGTFLLWTAVVLRWDGLGLGSGRPPRRVGGRRTSAGELLAQAGVPDLRVAEFGAVAVVLGAVGLLLGWAMFGTVGPAMVGAAGGAWVPVASARRARLRRRSLAREAWPRMIEELRLQAASLGRSLPQALLEVGAHGPEELRPAFSAARREWLMSTDFERTLAVLKDRLADPTADAVCETLLVAHEIGGQEVDGRLRALVEDRVLDLEGRKDAEARQAGARFARLFVLVVPLGMAMVGLTVGDGRLAYQTAAGQVAVLGALAMIAGCWAWASRIMRLPEEGRVFAPEGKAADLPAWARAGSMSPRRSPGRGST